MIRIPAWKLGAARMAEAAHRRRRRLGSTAIRRSESRHRPAAKSPSLEAIDGGGVKRRWSEWRGELAMALPTGCPQLFGVYAQAAQDRKKNAWPKKRAARYVSKHFP
jgi:hypothetical protein